LKKNDREVLLATHPAFANLDIINSVAMSFPGFQDVLTGKWTATDAGIGAGVDSYYEYLVKGSILLQRPG
jgi:hypothetical protein